jgi:hypothetical protein
MGNKHLRPSFETPRKGAAPQDDGGTCGNTVITRSACDEAILFLLVAFWIASLRSQ